MAINKVEDQNGQVLLDLTGDTVSADTLYKGAKAHDKFGNVIVGEAIPMEWHDIPTGATLLSQLLEIGFYSIKTSETFGDIPDGFVYDGTLEVLYHEHAGHQILRDSNGLAWARYIFESDVGEWASYSDSDVIDQILNRLDEHDNDISRLDADNERQDFQIADLKNIVYDTVVEDAEYTYDELDVAPIPAHVSDGTNYHKVFDGAETMLVEIQGKTAKSFNLWDETWERGTFSTTTGEKEGNSARIRSADFVEVPVGASIYCKTPAACTVFQYDANKVYIGYLAGTNRIVNLDAGCKYLNFNCGSSGAPITTYGNDICINISQPDTSVSPHNGDYEPHFGLKSSVVSGVQINGANLWDEEWEVGAWINGVKSNAQSVRSANIYPCHPNTTYYTLKGIFVTFFDEEKNYLSRQSYSSVFTTPANAYWFAFNTTSAYGTVYNHDIAIFLGNTAHPYRPYKPPFNFTLPSPQELRSAGTVRDTIRIVQQVDGTWNVEKVVNVGEASGSTYELETPIVTTLMTGLTEPDIATLIELYGSVEIVGNTQKQYAKPNLKTIIQVERAVEP